MTQLLLAFQPVESGDLKDVVMMDDSILFCFEEVSPIKLDSCKLFYSLAI